MSALPYKATYATNKRHGGWFLRIECKPDKYPSSPIITVSKKDDSTAQVLPTKTIWSGVDDKTGHHVFLCQFIPLAEFVSPAEKGDPF